MNVYINVPYSEKDQAKLLGARWDAVVSRWYYTDKQDALLFEKWFDKATSVVDTELLRDKRITLAEFVKQVYGDHHASLTAKAARAFGVPFPLVSGWLQTYGHRVANADKLIFRKKSKKRVSTTTDTLGKKTTSSDGGSQRRQAMFVPLCNCNVEPWEDCEHTDELAYKEFKKIVV